MAEKKLLTRIIMNHGEWASYAGKVARDGEVIYVKVGTTQANGKVSEPIWMQKIGDGTTQVQNLPWVVAPAADVYEWAKKSSLDANDLPAIPGDKLGITVTVTGAGNAITDASWDAATKTLTLTKGETFATKSFTDGELAKKADKVTNATAGNFAGLDENGNLTDSGKKATDFAEAGHNHDEDYSEIGHTHDITATDDDIIIATGGELSVDVKHKKELGEGKSYTTEESTGVSEFGKTATLKIPSLSVNEYGHVTAIEDKDVAISIPGLNEVAESSHTHTNGKGTVVTGEGAKAIDLNVEFKADLVAKDGKKYLQLVDFTSKEVIAEFDTTEFIKDGMLESVTKSETDNTITFTWNTDSGISETVIDIDDLVEVYTAGKGISIDNFVVSHQAKPTTGTAETATAGSGRTYVTEVLVDELGHIAGVKTATETDQDLTHNHDAQYVKLQEPINLDDEGGENSAEFNATSISFSGVSSDVRVNRHGVYVDTSEESSFGFGTDDAGGNFEVSGGVNAKIAWNSFLGTDRLDDIIDEDGNSHVDEADRLDGHDADYFATATHNHDDKYAPIGIDTGVMSVAAEATGGLKVDNTDVKNPKIAIDETVVFILDGGDASNLD